jgi:uncharacterized protein (TIGR02996 family)
MSTHEPEWIAFRGRNRRLLSLPLEAYLRELPSRPEFRVRDPGFERGYVGQWEIRADDTLWLTGLRTMPADEGPDPGIRLVFPAANGAVAASWVKQTLRTADSERRYNPMGYSSSFAHETRLEIWDGRLVMIEEIDGRSNRLIGTEFTDHLEGFFGSEESAFLRAIRAAPDDSAPRLVYADWLDERQDLRGQVVRLAEQLRGVSPADAAREWSANRDRLHGALGHRLWDQIMRYDETS